MKKKTSILIFSLSLLASFVFAHEFWLEPVKFLLKLNEKVTVNLMVGEDYNGEASNGHKYKIVKLDHFHKREIADLRSKVYGDSLSSIDMTFSENGSHLIAFNNTSKFIELEATKFNEYLRTEGLDHVIKMRVNAKDTLKSGKELYQRCVKTLLQVGDKTDETFAINTGMRLEIIPGTNPYDQKSTKPISFKILFDNKPLSNAFVLAWHRVNGASTHVTMRSNNKGEVSFPISKKGKWMISTVHMEETTISDQADWQSFWGSYTFGYY